MDKSTLRDGIETPPPHAVFLFDYTKPVSGPVHPDAYVADKQHGLYKVDPIELDDDDDDDDFRYQFDIEISRVALLAKYQAFHPTIDTMSGARFARRMRRVLNGSYALNTTIGNWTTELVCGASRHSRYTAG